MWPVAPKTSHTFCLGGFDGPGGSVVCGSEILDTSCENVVFSERWVDGDDGLLLSTGIMCENRQQSLLYSGRC